MGHGLTDDLDTLVGKQGLIDVGLLRGRTVERDLLGGQDEPLA
jgi:hypothetical protein